MSRIRNADRSAGRSSLSRSSKPQPDARISLHRVTPGSSCGDVIIRDHKGSISSPGYPAWRSNVTSFVNCTWTILVRKSEVLTLSFDDLHLKDNDCQNVDPSNTSKPNCCISLLQISSHLPEGEKSGHVKGLLYCGGDAEPLIVHPFISRGTGVRIALSAEIGGTIRGFHLTYHIAAEHSVACMPGEFRCASGRCIPETWRCNRKNECGDGSESDDSDESQCSDVCSEVTDVRCDARSDELVRNPGCYSFIYDRCNNKRDCEDGSDEIGCNGCPSDMFSCSSGNSCFNASANCDGIPDCVDFSDEMDCGLCSPAHVLCDPMGPIIQCYDPIRQRCDGQADCPNAVDEKGCRSFCGNKILCASGYGCYESGERCNGIPECPDYSDEKNCSSQICKPEHGSFLCSNKRCIRSSWVCDKSNDCGDASDEIDCLKNSVITAAIMGSLICGLLLVIAVSCTCKLIALRQVDDSHALSRSDVQISDQHLLQLEPDSFFFHREPPPSYSAAICSTPTVTFDSCDRRRIRRIRRQRRRPPSPPSDATRAPCESAERSLMGQRADPFAPADGDADQSTTRHELLVQIDKTLDDETKDEEEGGSDLTRVPDPETMSLVVNIELDSIASVHPATVNNCDQEPLLQ